MTNQNLTYLEEGRALENNLRYCQDTKKGKCILGQLAGTDSCTGAVKPSTRILMYLRNGRDEKTGTSRQLRVKEHPLTKGISPTMTFTSQPIGS